MKQCGMTGSDNTCSYIASARTKCIYGIPLEQEVVYINLHALTYMMQSSTAKLTQASSYIEPFTRSVPIMSSTSHYNNIL